MKQWTTIWIQTIIVCTRRHCIGAMVVVLNSIMEEKYLFSFTRQVTVALFRFCSPASTFDLLHVDLLSRNNPTIAACRFLLKREALRLCAHRSRILYPGGAYRVRRDTATLSRNNISRYWSYSTSSDRLHIMWSLPKEHETSLFVNEDPDPDRERLWNKWRWRYMNV